MVLDAKFLFRNRESAAHQLGERLLSYGQQNAVVVAISGNSMRVASHVASALDAKLVLVPYETIHDPTYTSKVIGAVSLDCCVIKEQLRDMPQDFLYHRVQEIKNNLTRTATVASHVNQAMFYHKIVILVSDFSESGYEILACLKTIEKFHPSKTIIAIPVITAEASSTIAAGNSQSELLFLEVTSGNSIQIPYADDSEVYPGVFSQS